MDNTKIIFLGTPDISAFLLEGMVRAGFNIIGVITREDKPQGRNKIMQPSKVGACAARLGLKVFKPHRLNKDHAFLADLKPDILITFAYGQIISEEVLGFSRLPPLNFHASLLPQYRGAAPLQYALRNGESETGISLMEMVREMDAGDVFAQERIAISPDDNYTSLSLRIEKLALEMAVRYLPLFFGGKLRGVSQDSSAATFAPSIKKEEEHLILNQDPRSFVNQVRSLSLTPGGYLLDEGGKPLKIYEAKAEDDSASYPLGTVISASGDDIVVQVLGGTVRLLKLQRPGKRILSARDFNNGIRDFAEKVLR